MPVSKEDIRARLKVGSVWITSLDHDDPTMFFTANVPERKMRYIVMLFVPGDLSATTRIELLQRNEGTGTPVVYAYETKFCPIPIAAADTLQIPEGGYSIEDPVLTLEGGTNLGASIDTVGTSLNLTCVFWDSDI